MPDKDITLLGAIDLFRLAVEAVSTGRIKAHEVDGMTDEGVEALIAQLQTSAQDKIDAGRELDHQ